MKKKHFFLVLVAYFFVGTIVAQAPTNKDPNATTPFTPNPKTNQKSLKHFANEKFGVYINWGPFTLRGQESSWSMHDRADYESYYSKWMPKEFDPNDWGDLCKTLGANYLVWVVKHHDGFCLWDTKTTDNNIMNFPYHRNITADIANMCKKYGLDFGACISIADIHDSKWNKMYPRGAKMPGFPEQIPQIGSLLERQTLEIINEYHPKMLWFDGAWLDGWRSSKYPIELETTFRKAESDILMTRLGNYTDDYESMEAKFLTYRKDPWETVTSVAYPRYTWGPDLKYKSVPFLVETFSRIVCGNGNYLLCFVPDADGKIPEVQQKIAAELGAWVHKSSDAIFDTKGGPYYPNNWGGSTRKGSKIYLYLASDAPETLTLPPLEAKILFSKMITAGKIRITPSKDSLYIQASLKDRDPQGVTIIELTLNHEVRGMIEASKPKTELKGSINNDVRPIEERKGKVLN